MLDLITIVILILIAIAIQVFSPFLKARALCDTNRTRLSSLKAVIGMDQCQQSLASCKLEELSMCVEALNVSYPGLT